MRTKYILVPGEALIDRFENTTEIVEKVGGAPLNVAGALLMLHPNTYFVGCVGKDLQGEQILHYLRLNHIPTMLIKQIIKRTTIAHVYLDSSGERHFTFTRGADEEMYLAAHQISDTKGVVLSSATAILENETYNVYLQYGLSKQINDALIAYDPNYRPALFNTPELKKLFLERSRILTSLADVAKFSEEEFELIYKHSYKDLVNNKELQREFALKLLVVTLGERGTFVYFKNTAFEVPSVKTTVVDTTGAGDSFFGYLVAQILKTTDNLLSLTVNEIKKMVFKANLCACFVISKIGALESLPSEDELERFYLKNKHLINE
ncbi:carbohydrate kinase family protein [Mycoplasmopsis columboralis]|uniref:5-dehydro-2-deoxygluconokinase n=1 Tax=Mycoplasmopsis columboralis TaxID=171282 RepID=A0A449B7N1_9BACT|nr:carbohydrate kinase [Mycoplasmopsis columboralis]VEU76579.1 5-dehydro-2-deoxygluconokinase [Mycoplasmopsis columboralis]